MEPLSKEEKEVLAILTELPELIAQRAAIPNLWGGPQWGGKRKRSVPADDGGNPLDVPPPPLPTEIGNGGEEDKLRSPPPPTPTGKSHLSPARHVSTAVSPSSLDLNLPPPPEEWEKPAVSAEARKRRKRSVPVDIAGLNPVVPNAVPPPLPKEINTGDQDTLCLPKQPIPHGRHVSTVEMPAEERKVRKLVLFMKGASPVVISH